MSNSREKIKKSRRIILAILLVAAILFFGACDLNLTALILSPSISTLEIYTGDTVEFQGVALGGIPFTDTDDPYGYFWYTDGNAVDEDKSTAAASTSVTFKEEGIFTIAFTVTDSEGDSDRASMTVIVTEKPEEEQEIEPLQAIILSPNLPSIEVKKGEKITFKGTGLGGVKFTDESGDSSETEPYGYFWDTLSLLDTDSELSETFKEVDVTFNETGVYVLRFTVKDSRNVTDTAAIQVTVIPSE